MKTPTLHNCKNAVELEKAVVAMGVAEQALDDLRESHKPECGCLLCNEAEGVSFVLRTHAASLEGIAAPFQTARLMCGVDRLLNRLLSK